jgi:hypothetical protein
VLCAGCHELFVEQMEVDLLEVHRRRRACSEVVDVAQVCVMASCERSDEEGNRKEWGCCERMFLELDEWQQRLFWSVLQHHWLDLAHAMLGSR